MDNVRILLKAIIKKEDKILALKRPTDAYSRPNCWDLPGGNLEYGENATECITREIGEETSLKVKNLRPFHVISESDPKKNIFWVEIGYVCEYVRGDVKLSSEHSEFRWLRIAQFLKLKSADYLREFINHL